MKCQMSGPGVTSPAATQRPLPEGEGESCVDSHPSACVDPHPSSCVDPHPNPLPEGEGTYFIPTSDLQPPISTSDLQSPISVSGLRPPVSNFQIIEKLRRKIDRLETASRADDGNVVPSGCRAVDQMLPEGGYRRGTLIEWITPNKRSGGHGADFVSLITAQKACEDGGALVVFDPERQFYPPAANALGISNSNLIVLRPPTRLSCANDDDHDELYWAIDQSLRCSAVAAVWGSLDHIGERWFRRFQLAAESSGTMGLFVRPATALNRPSWAEVQWKVVRPETEGRRSEYQTQNMKHETRNAKHETRNAKHETRNAKHETRNAKHKTRNAEYETVTSPSGRGRSSAPGEGIPSTPQGDHFRKLRLQLHRCRGSLTGKTIDLDINTITGSVCESTRTRSDHEPQPRDLYSRPRPSKTGPLSVAAQLAHSKTRRRTKRA